VEDGATDTAIDVALDAALDAGASACHPVGVSGFQPGAYIGPLVRSMACDGFNGEGGLVEAYGNACLSHNATYESCAGLSPPDAATASACLACLVTPERTDASQYGVVIATNASPIVNYFGCIQALDPTEAGVSCAHALDEAAQCADYACESVCPVSDDSSQAAFLACFNEALTGACLDHALRAQSCLATEQGDGGTPIAKVCFGGTTAEDHYSATARYFCGGS
jgi:hypothetical protein